LFQALIKSARESICITTPYFLPDRSARNALVEAVRERGVRVQIVTAGPYIDHPTVRKLSERSSRRLLEAGAEIYEYQPSMIHAKLLTVDGQWCVTMNLPVFWKGTLSRTSPAAAGSHSRS
jgi:cardiolipin synthase